MAHNLMTRGNDCNWVHIGKWLAANDAKLTLQAESIFRDAGSRSGLFVRVQTQWHSACTLLSYAEIDNAAGDIVSSVVNGLIKRVEIAERQESYKHRSNDNG